MGGWSEIINVAIGGAGGSGLGSAITFLLLRLHLKSNKERNDRLAEINEKLAARNDALAIQIADLKDEDISDLGKSIEKLGGQLADHLKADVSIQTTLTKLETQLSEIGSNMRRLFDWQTLTQQDNAGLKSDVRNLQNYIENVNKSLQELRRDMHHGK